MRRRQHQRYALILLSGTRGLGPQMTNPQCLGDLYGRDVHYPGPQLLICRWHLRGQVFTNKYREWSLLLIMRLYVALYVTE